MGGRRKPTVYLDHKLSTFYLTKTSYYRAGAKDILNKYYSSVGGRPSEPETNGTAKKRKSSTHLTGDTDSQTSKRPRKSNVDDEEENTKQWLPPANKQWEDYVATVQTIELDAKDKELYAFLEWRNGKKTKVNIGQAYKKCPMKMLKFYEQHLYVFCSRELCLNPLSLTQSKGCLRSHKSKTRNHFLALSVLATRHLEALVVPTPPAYLSARRLLQCTSLCLLLGSSIPLNCS